MSILVWQYIGWGMLAVIIIGALVLAYALFNDYKNGKDKVISLPELRPKAENGEKVFDKVSDESLAHRQTRSSRRKNANATDLNAPLATKSSAFFEDDGDDFVLPSGND